MRKPWTGEQLALLRRHYPTSRAKAVAPIVGHPWMAVIAKAKQLGIAKARRQIRRPWTDVEIARLRELYPDTPSHVIARELGRPLHHIYNRAQVLGLAKSEAYLASPHACRLRRGDNVGARSRFQKGHVPANKGLRRPGWFSGRMQETQFKKGMRSGVAAQNWMPVGAERDIDGYRYTKISDVPNVPYSRNWRPTHVLLWEKHYGTVPPGYALKFIDGDRANVALGNLCLVSRADLGRLNVMWNRYPRELCEVIQLRGAVRRRIRRKQREEQDRRSA